ncbi:MAG: glucan 1,4-alpha-glucosidase [Chloroflexota bacterium]|nr:glucan 1,4-alpha-glucosidase [Chloroflexota bacterium]
MGPTWSSSAKDFVVTALGPSRLWATLGHGIVNEVYWPATGMPQIRDLGFIVAGGGRWTEVKRQARYALSTPAPWLPLPTVVHQGNEYRLTLEYLPDPTRDVLLISYRLEGEGLRLYPLLAPHLSRSGTNNTAWVDGHDLHAQRQDRALCLSSYPPFRRGSAGFVGASDGWQDFAHNGAMTWDFARAEDGNVALMGELDEPSGVLALAFALGSSGASTLARSSLAEGYSHIRDRFIEQWTGWSERLRLPASDPALASAAGLSAVVLRGHEDRTYPGAIVASLSIPWGTRGNDPGGYHLVWTRDLVEAALGLFVAGGIEDCKRVLAYLAARQEPDGHWAQNFFPDGQGYWRGMQIDEVALPILLAARLRQAGEHETAATREMVRRAAGYVVRSGPLTEQDRWEENAGASPFTLACEIAALVGASPYLDSAAERDYVLALADCWNERIEEWTYARGTPLSRRFGVDGYYVRIAAPPSAGGIDGEIAVRNRGGLTVRAHEMVGLEFSYLVRLGLRDPQDERIRNTLTVVDGTIRHEMPSGPGYYRYNGDGYGEHADGSPFDGEGIGRIWPLLTGERGHLALLQGEDPQPYLRAMNGMRGKCGLIPEQVWDGDALPDRGLFPGAPTGSAMPLVWAHAELLKLLAACSDGRPVELLDVVRDRYAGRAPKAATWYWREEVPFATLDRGRALVIEDRRPFVLRPTYDGRAQADRPATPLGLGMFGVRLDPDGLGGASEIRFRRMGADGQPWDERDQVITVRDV